MISSQTFDNHRLTQGVRSHSVPPVRAAKGGASRRAAEGEGSGLLFVLVPCFMLHVL